MNNNEELRSTTLLIFILLAVFEVFSSVRSLKSEFRCSKIEKDIESLKEQNKEIIDKETEYIFLTKSNYAGIYETEALYNEVLKGVPYKVFNVDNPELHKKKIYTEFTEVTLKSSLQYKLLYSDWDNDGVPDRYSDVLSGVRVITDQFGVDRFCVAVGTYWANGEIGRFIDFVMENGNIIPCITCDVKQDIHTKNWRGKYGSAANDLIEFYVDPMVLPIVDYCDDGSGIGLRFPAGDVSKAREDFEGAIVKVIVYDAYFEGFEFQMNE